MSLDTAQDRLEGYRLSPQQEEVWRRSADGGDAWGAAALVELRGEVDREALRRALDRLVGRHDALRARFERLPGMGLPVQVVEEAGRAAWSPSPETGGEAAIEAARRAFAAPVASSARGLEAVWIPAGRGEDGEAGRPMSFLVLRLPALAADEASLENLFAELVEAYAAEAAGDGDGGGDDDEGVSYLQFAEWQQQLLEEPEEEAETHWREAAGPGEGTARPARLPFELPPAQGPFTPAGVPLALEAGSAERLAELAAELGAEEEALVVAGWLAVLGRLAGGGEAALRHRWTGRDHEMLAGAVGLFERWLPLRVKLDPRTPWSDLARDVAEAMAAGLDAAPFLPPTAGNGETPMAAGFGHAAELRSPAGPREAAGVVFQPVARRAHLAPFATRLALARGAAGDPLTGVLFHDRRRVTDADARILARQTERAFAVLLARPDTEVGELDLLTGDERRLLVEVFNAPDGPLPEAASFPERFREQAERTPTAVALVASGEDGEEIRLTYEELAAASSRLAARLRGAGVGAEARVAVCLPRTAAPVVAMLAAFEAGGACAVLDSGQPDARLAAMLEDAGAAVLVTTAELAPRFTAFPGRVLDIADAVSGSDSAAPFPVPARSPEPEQLAYLIFTSGSTGRPKGVAVEHRNLARYLDGALRRLELPEGAGYALVSTLAADLGFTSVFPALATGGTLHVIPQERTADAAAMAAYGADHDIDCMKVVPSHLKALLDAAAESGDPYRLLPARRLVLGGEAASPAWAASLAGDGAPERRVFNHYGPSETTVGALTWELTAHGEDMDPRWDSLPLGRPLPGVRVYVTDRALRPVPRWTAGEILIGGAGVARGYLGRPGATAERFVPDPFAGPPGGGAAGERLYRTGDLGRHTAGGAVEFRGRIDRQVKLHGFRVELDEVRHLLEAHPEVDAGAAVLRRDPRGSDLLVAFYAAPRELAGEDLRRFLAQRLPAEVLPSAFVHLRSLPLTANGKVDHAALPSYEEIRARLGRRSTPPRTPTEELLASLWCEVLHLERVGVEDGFFQLGGHSLIATQLVSRIRRAFEVDLPLRMVFDEPGLGAMAARVDEALGAGAARRSAPEIVPAARTGELPLSFAQERLWFMHQLDPGSAAYNVPVAIRVGGPLRPAALTAALGHVTARHEVLRTRYPADGSGRPRQVVEPPFAARMPVVDLSALGAEDREGEARRAAEREAARPFRLDRLPLLRARLVRLAPEQHLALFTVHHVAFDAASGDVFVRELTEAYAAFAEGRTPAAAPKALQYADYAVWQRAWMESEALAGELDWWRRRLGGLPEESPLPPARPRPEVPTFRGGAVARELPAGLVAGLDDLSRRERVTPFMTLLAIFTALLHRHGGAEDVVVGTDVAGRNHLALEEQIGFFVNNLVLRVDASGNPTFRELLGRVREVSLGAYAHQDLPFDRLVKELRPSRELARTPLFQVLFVLQPETDSEARIEGLSFESVSGASATAKFDVALFLRRDGGAIRAAWSFNRDLFETPTIERLADRYVGLAAALSERPDTRLNEMEVPSEMDKKRSEESSLGRLRALKKGGSAGRSAAPPPSASRGLFRESLPAEGATLPLVLEPAAPDLDLAGWAEASRDEIEARLHRHGALLFRGFDLGSVPEFERFARAACPTLYGEYGDLPREKEGTTVYHSTPYPEDMTILFHNESSHLPRWPLKQFFYCVQAAPKGGETPLVDCRVVYRELDPELAEEFEKRGLLYVRNFTAGLDVAWQDFFRTDDRSAVEARCAAMGMEARWKGDDLETLQPCAAVRRHPKTGEKVFFNQVELHHPYFLGETVRSSMLAVFGEDRLPRNVLWGDGEVISDDVMRRVEELYWRCSAAAPWRDDDVVMVDNMLVAHARKPYTPPRKIVVAMGELMDAPEIAAAGGEAL